MTEFQKYILDSINCEELDIWEGCDKDIKLNYVYAVFIKEILCAGKDKIHQQVEFSNWLAGLPGTMFIAYKNEEIIELGKKYGLLKKRPTDIEENLFLINWFTLVSREFFKMLRGI